MSGSGDELDNSRLIQELIKAAERKESYRQAEEEAHSDNEEIDESHPDYPFNQFSEDFSTLGVTSVEVVHADTLTPLIFYRDYVSKNRPVVIEGALTNWPAMEKWRDDEYLASVAGQEEVTIDFTPDGRGDSLIHDRLFVTPVEEKMKFGDFLGLLEDVPITHNDAHAYVDTKKTPAGIPYCQHQNGSFADEFRALHKDAALDLPFATEAIGSAPDAANFWMGDGRSMSSMHHDPYENLYAVVRGEKVFTLVPPGDAYFLDRREFPCARWVRDDQGWAEMHKRRETGEPEPADAPIDRSEHDNDDFIFYREKREAAVKAAEAATVATEADDVEVEVVSNTPYRSEASEPVDPMRMVRKGPFVTEPVEGKVPWIDLDVDTSPLFYPPGTRRARLMRAYQNINKYIVTVKAGQVLYLPSLWFHAVRQQGKTIAVNYWYDMSYDVRFLHMDFMNRVAAMKQKEYKDKAPPTDALSSSTVNQ